MDAGRVSRLGAYALVVCLSLSCAPEVGAPGSEPGAASVAQASSARKRAYEPVLVELEAQLAATDWRTLDGTEVRRGKSSVGTSPDGGGVAFQRRWFSGTRGGVVGFSVNARGGEVPLLAIYGPDKYAVARRVEFAVGEGSPARATLKVRLPADGRYLLVVGDVSAVAEPSSLMSSSTEVGRATAYLAAPEEEQASCDCPCEKTKCVGDELWAVDDEGNPTEKLKTCGEGECVDVTEGGPAHGECIDKTTCCEGGGLCEVNEDGSEGRKLRARSECVVCTNGRDSDGEPQATCETAEEHCTGIGGSDCDACEDDPFCHMCGGLCTPNEAETNANGAGCVKVSEGARRHCDGDDDPPPDAGRPDATVTVTDSGLAQPASKAIVPPPNCQDLSESTCPRIDYCGWCADGAGACMVGSESGPTSGTCSEGNWRYGL